MDKLDAIEVVDAIVKVIEDRSKEATGSQSVNYAYTSGALSVVLQSACMNLNQEQLAKLMKLHA